MSAAATDPDAGPVAGTIAALPSPPRGYRGAPAPEWAISTSTRPTWW